MTQKLDCFAGLEASVSDPSAWRRVSACGALGWRGETISGRSAPAENRHLPAGDLALCARHHRAAFRFATHCRNAKQFTLRLRQQIGKAHRIINVRANIRVEKIILWA